MLHSKLQLVDLAGSERLSYFVDEAPQREKECIDINKSLFTLRQVITMLAEAQKTRRQTYIPYRDSKLTSLLCQGIGGNSFTLMIACVSPSDRNVEENVSTLMYATRAAYIANEPVRNQDPKLRAIAQLKVRVAPEMGRAKWENLRPNCPRRTNKLGC